MTDAVAELLGEAPASVDGGEMTFLRGDLGATLWMWKDRRDRGIFGAKPADIPQAACYPWPVSGQPLATEASAAFAQYGHPSLRFARDRRDLGQLLLADTHVHRGELWSFTPANSLPGRLAKAFLLARHTGDQDLVQAALAKLRDRGEEPVLGPDYLFRHAFADHAKMDSRATGVDLGDLAGLKRKRPRYPGAS